MKNRSLFSRFAAGFCALSLFVGRLSAQLPCYLDLYQPKFPANAEKLTRR